MPHIGYQTSSLASKPSQWTHSHPVLAPAATKWSSVRPRGYGEEPKIPSNFRRWDWGWGHEKYWSQSSWESPQALI